VGALEVRQAEVAQRPPPDRERVHVVLEQRGVAGVGPRLPGGLVRREPERAVLAERRLAVERDRVERDARAVVDDGLVRIGRLPRRENRMRRRPFSSRCSTIHRMRLCR
jgi:hypothetical protein